MKWDILNARPSGAAVGRYARILIGIGVAIHFAYVISIFDIYFTSPVVHGMTPATPALPAPAKRLVLIVADGLRADRFFETVQDGDNGSGTRTPYLRDVIENRGAYGVSHTRVPTESRPGHVAIIAGLYEDVSAVTKGWKENPVEFDSVFNQSRQTWSWGSPDILPMFATGEHTRKVIHTDMYTPEQEDFASSNPASLDDWVLQHMETFFHEAEEDPSLNQQIGEDGVVFFLHLLATDTLGHAYRPYSTEYLNNIRAVDTIVQKVESLVNDHFKDDKTAFLFTADHGMTNRGSHGAAGREETETPFVAWGSGVSGPLPPQPEDVQEDDRIEDDDHKTDWNLGHLRRRDIRQADIAPLMSTLLGVPVPMNNVGLLPTGYLSGSEEFRARALAANAHQVFAQFQRKATIKEDYTLSFVQFPELDHHTNGIPQHSPIYTSMKEGKFAKARRLTREFISLCLKGMRYYETYHRQFLLTVVVLGYFGWMACVLMFVISNFSTVRAGAIPSVPKRTRSWEVAIDGLAVVIGMLLMGFLLIQRAPITFYFYIVPPVYFWWQVMKNIGIVRSFYSILVTDKLLKTAAITVISVLCGLELIVVSFEHRWVLTPVVLFVGALAQFNVSMLSRPQIAWYVTCAVVSVFPSVPVTTGKRSWLILSSILPVALGVKMLLEFYRNRLSRKTKTDDTGFSFIYLQTGIYIFTTLLCVYTDNELDAKRGLSPVIQVTNWVLLFGSVIVPTMVQSADVVLRVLNIALGLATAYVLLTVNFEALFFVFLGCLCVVWAVLETQTTAVNTEANRALGPIDMQRAAFAVFFTVVAFFGTGNIASISSFEAASSFRFVTTFLPWIMAPLIAFKILLPILLVGCTFSALTRSLHVSTEGLFLVCLLLSDVLAINFLFLVKDYGSWRDIGESICHYVIMGAFVVFMALFQLLSVFYTKGVVQTRWTNAPSSKGK